MCVLTAGTPQSLAMSAKISASGLVHPDVGPMRTDCRHITKNINGSSDCRTMEVSAAVRTRSHTPTEKNEVRPGFKEQLCRIFGNSMDEISSVTLGHDGEA